MALPLLLAPLLGKLAENGLGLLASAVTAKGKDLIEEKLGVDLDKEMGSEEGRIRLRELELKHEEFLIESAQKKAEQELEVIKVSNADTASARDMNTRIQESTNASGFAKNAAYYLDFVIVGATLVLAYILFFVQIPEENLQLLYMGFGSLLTMCGTILNFHRGTSHSSREKDSAIHGILGDKKL
jgi:hypothetical protein